MIFESTHGVRFLDKMAKEIYNDLIDRRKVYLGLKTK